MSRLIFVLAMLLAVSAVAQQNGTNADPPLEWIEPETGHRVIRLSREPGTASLYFHQNAYTASGDKLVVTTPKGIATIELQTRKLEVIVEGRAGSLVVGRKTRQVFYIKDGAVMATHLDTRATREIVKQPELGTGSGLAVNADETLLGGSFVENNASAGFQPPASTQPGQRLDNYPGKGEMMERRLAARLPMALYTINIQSGEVNTFYHATDWLNHVQFSPTDPDLMMFCHEGPWHKVDRIWTIRVDGTQKRLMHKRTMEMEIAGHEFFSADGKTIWYDLQTPKGKEFWLAGVEIATGKQTRYRVAREHWSVHFNIALDGRLFAGDGGGPNSVAAPGNGQWIYLFTPRNGELQVEKLVNLRRHNYQLEPNVTFTPDMKWIVFRSNIHGATHVYAVEVAKANPTLRSSIDAPANDPGKSKSEALPPLLSLEELQRQFQNPPDEARIMMRWWWFGPAVTKAGIERELRLMKEGGIGGVEIQPVYPLAVDDESKGIRNMRYLSPEFLDALQYANNKARELGMRVDLTLGSGWPYGGPMIPVTRAAGRLRVERLKVQTQQRSVPLPKMAEWEKLLGCHLVSTPPGSERHIKGNIHSEATHPTVGGTDSIRELDKIKEGTIELPESLTSSDEVLCFIASRTRQQVKRAAFGAEGFVLDHYDRAALDDYLKKVGEPLLEAFGSQPPYAIFCDSLEVFNSDWTSDFLPEFQRRRGYDLKPLLPALVCEIGPQTAAIRHDWGQTLTELLNERFLAPLQQWAKQHNTRLRIQGYGIPPATIGSNIYADLTEGEGSHWKILRAARWASSANHLYGRNITSSETWTWLHSPAFRATPLDVKAEADLHFLQGVNQLIGHGWPYTAEGVEYPGWRFYAAAVFNEKNPWWIVMPDISKYLQRVSYLMRQGMPANDIAFYLPNSDAWAGFINPKVHYMIEALKDRIGENDVAQVLEAGFNLDFFDDDVLRQIGKVEPGALTLGPNKYKAVLLPNVERMPLATLQKLEDFARQGGVVIAVRRKPAVAPGYQVSDAERAQIHKLTQRLFESPSAPAYFVADDKHLGSKLAALVRPDVKLTPAASGIGFIHRHTPDAEIYFLANSTNERQSVRAVFNAQGRQAESWNAFTGSVAPLKAKFEANGTSLALEFEPYESKIIVISRRTLPRPAEAQLGNVPAPLDLSTGWRVAIGPNGQAQPIERLRSWTESEITRFYSGTATYEKEMTVPDGWLRPGMSARLDFGAGKAVPVQARKNGMRSWLDAPIREAAVVYVNDQRAGAVWCPPYSLDVTRLLRSGANRLRIIVGNTAINHMAGRQPPDYRALNQRYGERFQAQDMENLQPLPSGLLGPVHLVAQ